VRTVRTDGQIAHTFLSEKYSKKERAKYRTEPKPEPQVTVVKKEVPPTSAVVEEAVAPTAPEVAEAQVQTVEILKGENE
jgi:hypothetical protein